MSLRCFDVLASGSVNTVRYSWSTICRGHVLFGRQEETRIVDDTVNNPHLSICCPECPFVAASRSSKRCGGPLASGAAFQHLLLGSWCLPLPFTSGAFRGLAPEYATNHKFRTEPKTQNEHFPGHPLFLKIRFYKIGTLSTSTLCGVVFDTVWNRGCDAERQFFLTCAMCVKTWHNVIRKCSKSVACSNEVALGRDDTHVSTRAHPTS